MYCCIYTYSFLFNNTGRLAIPREICLKRANVYPSLIDKLLQFSD
jgi:hypothetical protein